jgi:tetratricopeptide (TPR) repeat protein
MAQSREIEKLERRWQENPLGLTFAPLAEAYRKEGMYADALELLEIGLAQHPNYVPAHIVRGRCYLDTSRDADANAAFQRVADLDPENVIALKGLAEIAERAGRFEEAAERLELLLAFDRNNDEARVQLDRIQSILATPSPGTIEPETVLIGDVPSEAEPLGDVREPVSLAHEVFGLPDALPVVAEPVVPAAEPAASVSPVEPEAAEQEQPVTSDTGLDADESAPVDLDSTIESPPGVAAVPAEIEEPAGLELAALEVSRAAYDEPPEPYDESAEPSAEPAERDDEPVEPYDEQLVEAGEPVDDVDAMLADEAIAREDALYGDAEPDLEPFAAGASAGQTPSFEEPELSAEAPLQADLAAEPVEESDALPADDEVAEPAALPDDDGAPDLVVTETMAEIFLRQGHRELALAVYTQLAQRDPEAPRIADAIARLSAELQPAEPRTPVYAASLTGGQSVRAFLEGVLTALPPGASAGGPALGAVFGEAPAEPEAGADGPSYDEFFAAAEPPSAPSPAAPERTPADAPAAGRSDDIEEFNAWLRGLKR